MMKIQMIIKKNCIIKVIQKFIILKFMKIKKIIILYLKKIEDESNENKNSSIPASKSAQQLNQLPRVKFLSDYDVNQSENLYQPLINKDSSAIEMANADSWLDEKGLIIKDKSKSNEIKKASTEKS